MAGDRGRKPRVRSVDRPEDGGHPLVGKPGAVPFVAPGRGAAGDAVLAEDREDRPVAPALDGPEPLGVGAADADGAPGLEGEFTLVGAEGRRFVSDRGGFCAFLYTIRPAGCLRCRSSTSARRPHRAGGHPVDWRGLDDRCREAKTPESGPSIAKLVPWPHDPPGCLTGRMRMWENGVALKRGTGPLKKLYADAIR